MEGWIKIYRKLLDWEWYTDSCTKDVFIHLLLTANVEDKKFKGHDVKRGQVVTGRKKLAEDLNLSERSVRTALEHLISTNELTIKTTNKFTIITICKFDDYQCRKNESDQQNDQQNANNRPTTDQQPTTTKEYIEDKKERIVVVVDNAHARESFDCLIQKGNSYFDLICMRMGWTEEDYFNAVTDFEATCEVDGIKHGGEKDILDHFRNWVSKRYRFGEKPFKKVESQQQQTCSVKKYNDGFSGDPSGYTEKL